MQWGVYSGVCTVGCVQWVCSDVCSVGVFSGCVQWVCTVGVYSGVLTAVDLLLSLRQATQALKGQRG